MDFCAVTRNELRNSTRSLQIPNQIFREPNQVFINRASLPYSLQWDFSKASEAPLPPTFRSLHHNNPHNLNPRITRTHTSHHPTLHHPTHRHQLQHQILCPTHHPTTTGNPFPTPVSFHHHPLSPQHIPTRPPPTTRPTPPRQPVTHSAHQTHPSPHHSLRQRSTPHPLPAGSAYRPHPNSREKSNSKLRAGANTGRSGTWNLPRSVPMRT